ncbi:MAG: hypothetical protein RL088_3315 [Verrucomicrobiota bacterium]|jgi:hypothetical protein
MSFRTITIISLFIFAAIFGRLQNIVLPTWAWVIWGILFALAIAAWFVVTRAVSALVRKTILFIPLAQKVASSTGGWPPFPVAGLENQIALVENEIRASLRYRPLQWLGVRAFRSHTGYFVAGIVEYCKAQSSDVVDSRMISGWLHGAAAEKLGEFAGDFVSGGCQIAVAVLGALGIAFAVPW